jgi:hypothetical protein
MEEVKGGLLPADLGPGRDLAMDALRRTQGAMRRRGRSLGLALVCVVLVFACLPEGQGLVAGLRKGGIPLAGILLAAAAWFFGQFVQVSRQLGGTGLAPQRSHAARAAWAFGGWLAGLALGEIVCAAIGWPANRSMIFGGAMSGLLLWIGEKLGELAEPTAVRTVHTLFGYDNPDDDQGNG